MKQLDICLKSKHHMNKLIYVLIFWQSYDYNNGDSDWIDPDIKLLAEYFDSKHSFWKISSNRNYETGTICKKDW